MWTLVAILGPALAFGLTAAYYYAMGSRWRARAEIAESALATTGRLLSRALGRATAAEAALASSHTREADLAHRLVVAAAGDPDRIAGLLDGLAPAGPADGPVRP